MGFVSASPAILEIVTKRAVLPRRCMIHLGASHYAGCDSKHDAAKNTKGSHFACAGCSSEHNLLKRNDHAQLRALTRPGSRQVWRALCRAWFGAHSILSCKQSKHLWNCTRINSTRSVGSAFSVWEPILRSFIVGPSGKFIFLDPLCFKF